MCSNSVFTLASPIDNTAVVFGGRLRLVLDQDLHRVSEHGTLEIGSCGSKELSGSQYYGEADELLEHHDFPSVQLGG